MDAPDPLAHVPDPTKRDQVCGFLGGGAGFVQILDAETETAILTDVLTALDVGADINREVARVIEMMAGAVEGGTIEPDSIDRNDERWHKELWRRNGD